ncbi:hypothetical protein, partial [Desulfuromonas acetoxidans]|uniref:hypothetical protein n=1 Tax=Desulfuromonas acetoxidans TaxID=891 RepID=UPI001A7EC21E
REPTGGRGSPRHVGTTIASGRCLPEQFVPNDEPLKIKVKVKVAGFRPGSRHTFGWPPKSMQKPA